MSKRDGASQRESGDQVPPDQTDEPQVVEFPVSFEEWFASVRPFQTLPAAGFRHRVRTQGELTAVKPRAEWDAAFTAFLGEES